MSVSESDNTVNPLASRLDGLCARWKQVLEAGGTDITAFRQELAAIQVDAKAHGGAGLVAALQRVALMTEVRECLELENPSSANDIAEFCSQSLDRLASQIRRDGLEADLRWVEEESSVRWGEYVSLLAPIPGEDLGTPDSFEAELAAPEDAPPAVDLDSLLRLFGGAAGASALAEADEADSLSDGGFAAAFNTDSPDDVLSAYSEPHPTPPWRPTDDLAWAHEPGDPGLPGTDDGVPFRASQAGEPADPLASLDPELQEAFLADATDLFERIQTIVLGDLSRPADQDAALHELERCYHTLKGAASSVGLTELAARVHALEEHLEAAAQHAGPVPLDLLHQSLEDLEQVIAVLSKKLPARAPLEPRTGAPVPDPGLAGAGDRQADEIANPAASSSSQASDGYIRVSCERIDELMGLVSELITRRGLWAAQADTMHEFAATARLGRNRLLSNIDRFRKLAQWRETWGEPGAVDAAELERRLAEQSEDLAALAETARGAADPLADDADALSRLSLRLWDALQAVRVVPVRGLFHRLARVARDASRVEDKAIEVVMIGEDAGLDRSVQDKAFEPLLHAVRNAVSHGIEPIEKRMAAGKPEVGRVTLEAKREGYTMVLKVHDDGRGLDYGAITAQGRRLGLIDLEEEPTIEQLNALVFRSGLSTRAQATSVSGRGVGMDVVAQEVARLQGTVAIASKRGEGTTLTIRLPARLALEQAMVFRLEGTAFALPLSSIELAQQLLTPEPAAIDGSPMVRVRNRHVQLLDGRRALGLPRAPSSSRPKLLVVRDEDESLALSVDVIDGPRELVIKPLGPLVAGHPYIAGTSLSPGGELILILDPCGLVRHRVDASTWGTTVPMDATPLRPAKVLIVDDAISVRRAARRHLRAFGLDTDEACDGLEALHKIRSESYRLVLVDLEIPRMDGFELLAELGRSGASAETPVVVITTRSDPQTLQRVLDLGARGLLPKPLGPDDLSRAIGPLLHSGPAAESPEFSLLCQPLR